MHHLPNALSHSAHVLFTLLTLVCAQPLFSATTTASEDIATERTLTLAADPWCPYNCAPGGDQEGYLIDIARQVFEPLGYRVQYLNLPWRRALEFSRRGVIDGAVGVTEGTEFGHLLGNQVLGYDETVLISRMGETLQYRRASDLKGLRVGVINNYSYDNGGELDTFIASNVNNVRVLYHEAALESLLQMLVANRVDVVLENRIVALYSIDRLRLTERLKIVPTGIRNALYIGFTPNAKSQQLKALLDKGIQSLRENGELDRILRRYGLQDWQP